MCWDYYYWRVKQICNFFNFFVPIQNFTYGMETKNIKFYIFIVIYKVDTGTVLFEFFQ